MTDPMPPTGSESSRAAALIGCLRQHRRRLLLIVAAQLPSVAFITIHPLLLKTLIDDAVVHANGSLAVVLIAAMAALLALNALGDLASHFLVARLAAAVVNGFRLRLFRHVHDLSVAFHTRSRAGAVMSRFTSDADAVERALMDELAPTVYFVLTTLVASLILFTIDVRLALLVLALLPVIPVSQRLLARRAARANDARQRSVARVVGAMHEGLAGQLAVKAFGLQGLLTRRFEKQLDALTRSSGRAGLLNGLLAATMTAAAYALLAVTIGVGTSMAIRGALTIGSLVAFFELVWFMAAAVEQLSAAVPSFEQAAAGLHRIEQLLSRRADEVDAPEAPALPALSHSIRFHDVGFSYDGRTPALTGIDLTIPAGQLVGVVGPSGSGKTTLLSLLLRFHDPSAGAVTFDGVDLRDVTRASLRAQIGVVLQDSFLFDTTVRENIRLGRLGATDADVEAAARASEIHDFIQTLPRGYDTRVGERGVRLSMGQRQRIALARALVLAPRILLLDEPTTGLDAETEESITRVLHRVATGRTVIWVTHRLASIADADRIVVLERGAIVAEGTHVALLDAGGAYRRAWRRQSRTEREGREAIAS